MARSGNNPEDHIKNESNTWKIVIDDDSKLEVGAEETNLVQTVTSASVSVVVLSASVLAATLTTKQHFAVASAEDEDVGITLPDVAEATGKTYTVKKVDVSANSVFLSGAGSDLIEGAAVLEMIGSGNSVSVTSDSLQWHVTAFFSGNLLI